MSDQAVHTQPRKGEAKAEPARVMEGAPAVAAQPPMPPPNPRSIPQAERPLAENRIKLAHASMADVGNIWIATTVLGTPWEKVAEDEFWSNKARDFRSGDRIWVYTDDMTYEGEIIVKKTWTFGAGAVNNRAEIHVRSFSVMSRPSDHPRVGEFEIVHLGPHMKWCLRSTISKKVVSEGHMTQEDAERARRSALASRAT
jgi:hypothetical protein